MLRSIRGKSPKVHPSAWVSETAYVIGDVEIKENASVWPGTVIRADDGKIIIGKNSVIEDNCMMHINGDIPMTIGENVLVGHGAVIHCLSVGDNTLVGIKAVLLTDAEIGEGCLIAAGALITPRTKIPPRSRVMGIPGQIKDQVSIENVAEMSGLSYYRDLAKEYKQLGY